MELTLDRLAGFLIFTSALALSTYFIINSYEYPQPIGYIEAKVYSYPIHLTIYREENYLIIDCVEGLTVKVTVVCFNDDGSYIYKLLSI